MQNLCACLIYASVRPDGQTESQCSQPVRFFYRLLFVCYQTGVNALVYVISWKLMNWWCQLAQVIHSTTRAWSDQLWGSWGQRSRSHEDEDRFWGVIRDAFRSSTVSCCIFVTGRGPDCFSVLKSMIAKPYWKELDHSIIVAANSQWRRHRLSACVTAHGRHLSTFGGVLMFQCGRLMLRIFEFGLLLFD